MSKFELSYKRFGERSILVEWPQKIDESILKNALEFKNHLLNSNIKDKVEVINAYNSLLIRYDVEIDNIYDKISSLKTHYNSISATTKTHFKRWKIPVCYDTVFGLDLDEISSKTGLEKSEIIDIHSSSIYKVFFIGFLPGFLYLGGLNEQLFFPRKSTPRLKVERGSVAIGASQTGIYPIESPGGWNIIGNSPINFFDKTGKIPCFANSGDEVQFIPVSLEEHIDIMILVESGVYQIESEVING